ncbi:hypothetical protein [Phytomonospora endophytica]|uniref:Uncharacterized protein n=1 Tax=Phytomonospora endophytica TaxID=714109 RepID=A0A841G005_9ACTN|nr:hypothetical protein [Phytomonospora endophytica]MBB6038019.1 hypothetical protein [Phytomonospora endophytica]GIG68919.1 hypothetical protein Pen01_52140 [Phytomonospora endophytica]
MSLAWPPGTDYDLPGMLIWDLGDGDEDQTDEEGASGRSLG